MQIDALQIQIVEGRFLCISIQKLQIGGRQSLFGGCHFTVWRVPIYILEAEIVLGVLYRKGVIPKKGGTLDSREKMLAQKKDSRMQSHLNGRRSEIGADDTPGRRLLGILRQKQCIAEN